MSANQKTQALVYVRMSSTEQQDGDSRRRQLALAKDFAERSGLELVTDFLGGPFEDVGLSAFTGEHLASGNFGRFMTALRRKQLAAPVDYLLVESLDRVSRQSPMIALKTFIEIVEAGIVLVTTADGRCYRNDMDLSDLVSSIVFMSRSNEESERKKSRSDASWNHKRTATENRKLTSIRPAWLEIAAWDNTGRQPLPKTFKPIPERAAIVRRIFNECAKGIGYRTIAKRLNSDGVSTFGRSKIWQPSYVEKILNNRAVLGELQFHRLISKKPHKREPIGDPNVNYYGKGVVDIKLFERALASRHGRKSLSEVRNVGIGKGGARGTNISNLFSGLLFCDYCESRIIIQNKGTIRGGRYLVCVNPACAYIDNQVQMNLPRPARKGWNYIHFEKAFLAWVTQLDLASLLQPDDENNRPQKELEERVQTLAGRRIAAQNERERAYQLLTRDPSDVFADQKYQEIRKRLANIENGHAAAAKELANWSVERAVARESREEIRALIEKLQASGDFAYLLRAQVAAKLRSLVAKIDLAPAGLNISQGRWPDSNIENFVPDADVLEMQKKRFFNVHFKDGTFLVIYPEANPYRPVIFIK